MFSLETNLEGRKDERGDVGRGSYVSNMLFITAIGAADK